MQSAVLSKFIVTWFVIVFKVKFLYHKQIVHVVKMIKVPSHILCYNYSPIVNNIVKRTCSNVNNHFDIIVTGGGMVGVTMACSLAFQNKLADKRILLLEATREKEWKVSKQYSNRVSAINTSTKTLLESLGAWDIIKKIRFSSVKKMQVWESHSDAMITFNHDNLSRNVAYIVENDVLVHAVKTALKSKPNVTIKYKSKVKDYKLPKATDSIVNVEMEDGITYSCNLLIGADGINSRVRKAMNVQYLSWPYEQRGLVATVKISEPTENVVAWQRFLPTGPIALLPLTHQLSSLVWTTTSAEARKLLSLSPELFVDEVNNALWQKPKRSEILDTVTVSVNNFLRQLNLETSIPKQLPPNISEIDPDSRAAFPLGFGHASNYVCQSVALVGDAAHRVHPLAGQGVNLGFGDVICLTEILAAAVYNGNNIGCLKHLNEYETVRQRHVVPTAFGIDALHKLYGTSITPVVLLRSVGLQLTNSFPPLKRAIMDHARI